jgi:hypothetical protein
MSSAGIRTTVSISKDTKTKMDKWRADGQCYDAFLQQTIDLWERMHKNRIVDPAEKGYKTRFKR